MKSTRWGSLVLVALLLLSLLAGCGNAESEAASVSNPADVSVKSAEEISESKPVTEPDISTAEPLEEVPELPENLTMPLSEEPTTLTMFMSEVNLMGPMASLGYTDYNDYAYMQDLEALSNVHIDFTYASFFTYGEELNLMLATGDYPDMIKGLDMSFSGGAVAATEQDISVDLTDLMEESAPHYLQAVNEAGMTENVTYAGRYLDVHEFYDEFEMDQGICIRQDWLDELGLATPYTWEQFYDVLMAFKSEYNCSDALFFSAECYVLNYGGFTIPYFDCTRSSLPYYQIDGTVYCSLTTDDYRDYLEEMNRYYNNGLVNPDFMSNATSRSNSDKFNEQMLNNQIGIWASATNGFTTLDAMEMEENFESSALVGPADNKGDVSYCASVVNHDGINIAITTACDNVELALKWLDYWYTKDGILRYNYGIENQDYTIEDDGSITISDSILNNDLGVSVNEYMRKDCAYSVFAGLALRHRLDFTMTDKQLEAWDIWTAAADGSRNLPEALTLDADAASVEAAKASDIATYASEMIPKFILGNADIFDDAVWSEYCSSLESMGLNDCVTLWQDALDDF